MDRYYTDEEIDFGQDERWNDGSTDDTYSLPPGTDSIHNWDYFEPEDEETERRLDFGNRQADSYDGALGHDSQATVADRDD